LVFRAYSWLSTELAEMGFTGRSRGTAVLDAPGAEEMVPLLNPFGPHWSRPSREAQSCGRRASPSGLMAVGRVPS